MVHSTSRPEAKVLVVSDRVAAGVSQDSSGRALADCLNKAGFSVVDRQVVADGIDSVAEALIRMAQNFAGLLITTGGTGFSPRDLTPEATLRVLEREAPGMAETMRQANPPLGGLSRGRAGTVGGCLILNVPGSVAGATESLGAVLGILPHALGLLAGSHDGHK